MDRGRAAQLARHYIGIYCPSGWTFAFDNAKARHGQTDYQRRRITLSRYFVELNDEDMVKETILHEVAHVLAGSAAAHGPKWRAIAVSLGVRPQASKRSNMPVGKWRGLCTCGYPHFKHRKPRTRLMCTKCMDDITWIDYEPQVLQI